MAREGESDWGEDLIERWWEEAIALDPGEVGRAAHCDRVRLRRSNSDPDIRGYDKTQTMTSSTGSSFKCRVIRDDHRNEESVRDCLHDESRVRGSNGDRAMHITREERQTVEYLSFSSNANQGLFFGGSSATRSNDNEEKEKESQETERQKRLQKRLKMLQQQQQQQQQQLLQQQQRIRQESERQKRLQMLQQHQPQQQHRLRRSNSEPDILATVESRRRRKQSLPAASRQGTMLTYADVC
jgi:hypothetical protein